MLCGVFSSAIYVIGSVRLMQITVPVILFRIVTHPQAQTRFQYFCTLVELYNQKFCTLVELYNQKTRLSKMLCNNGSSLSENIYQEMRNVWKNAQFGYETETDDDDETDDDETDDDETDDDE